MNQPSHKAPAPLETTAPASENPPRLRLEFLDGLRGLAALYVVVYHAYTEVLQSGVFPVFPHRWARLLNWLQYGRFSVDVFIVLSGFCLMLPVARSGALHGGLTGFARRRAQRILPPYYAAVLLSLLLIAAVPALRHFPDARWRLVFPAFTAGSLLSHLFLVHNLSAAWLYTIDTPLWSVATEWQIYFVFALLLLPIYRKAGMPVAAVVALLLGFAPLYLFRHRLDGACPQYLGLFGFGMAGAALLYARQTWMQRVPCGSIALLITLFLAYAGWRGHEIVAWKLDTLLGAATACLLTAAARSPQNTSAPVRALARFLSWSALVRLGVFSYSLYLIHWPILALTHLAVLKLHPSAPLDMALMLILGTALALIAAYAFHLIFERPFLPGHPRTPRQRVAATVREPAL